MSSMSPTILILGSGPRVGQHVARAFAGQGYKVALASRNQKEEDSTGNQFNISIDLSDPASVVGVFSKVKAKLGVPSVVVYNGNTLFHRISLLLTFLKLVQQLPTQQRTHFPYPWQTSIETGTLTPPAPSSLPSKRLWASNNFRIRRRGPSSILGTC